jgi:hypothetical protein
MSEYIPVSDPRHPGYMHPAGAMGYPKRVRRGSPGGLARARQLRAMPRTRGPRPRTRQQALALRYRQQQPTRQQLEDAYLEAGGRSDGAETFAMVIMQDWKLVRHRGDQATTTGPRRAQGLGGAGRPRVSRTVRRHRATAVRLGFAAYHHVKHSSAERRRDHLRVEMFTKMSTCLRQQEQTPHSVVCSPASPANSRSDSSSEPPAGLVARCEGDVEHARRIWGRRDRRPATPAGIGPPYGGSGDPPAEPAGTANGSDEDAEPPAALVARCGGDIESARRFWSRR